MKQKLTSPGVARFTKALLDILFYAGIAVTVSLPWTMRWAARFYPSFAARLTLHTALFLLAGVCAVLILFELRRMLKTVVSGDCFVHQNVSSLCRMAYYAFAIAALMAVGSSCSSRRGCSPSCACFCWRVSSRSCSHRCSTAP